MADLYNPLTPAVLKAFQELHLAQKEIFQPYRQLALSVEKVVKSLQKRAQVTSQIQNALREQADQVQNALREQAKLLEQKHRRIAEELQRCGQQWIQAQPKRDREDREALQKWAELGWYCDPDMPWTALSQCARAIDKGDTREGIEAIREYFQEQLDTIEKKLATSYPHRRQVLHDAFNAHREGKYNLSVPVFLTQADGIWEEKFSTNLFSHKGREKAVNDDILQVKHGLFRSIYSLFLTPKPLWKSESERSSSFDELNRHQVLHGEVVNYGTEQNSLKVISFLSCLCWILSK